MTRIFTLKGFARFQRKERISDASLRKAIGGVEAGLIDADLGGGLVKQRLARGFPGLTTRQIAALIAENELMEVTYDDAR